MRNSSAELISELHNLRNKFSTATTKLILELIDQLSAVNITSPEALKTYHATLLYLSAFPQHQNIYKKVKQELSSFYKRVEKLTESQHYKLQDSGIDGSDLSHEFSYEAAGWLIKDFPDEIDIDWENYETPTKLDEVLMPLICHSEEPIFTAEEQIFPHGSVDTEEWLVKAKGNSKFSDIKWLFEEMRLSSYDDVLWEPLYALAEVPLCWQFRSSKGSLTQATIDPARVTYRNGDFPKVKGLPKNRIKKPTSRIHLASKKEAIKLLDMARWMLAARQREVHAFNHASLSEVYVGDLGFGAQIIVFGVKPEYRLSLEANYGFVILSNGVPVGYGGVSSLFHQINTGVNIFEEFRKSCATYLFVETLRVFRELFQPKYMLINPYQFGRNNEEGIESGAFWFYYKLGFRPVDSDALELSEKEFNKIKKNRKYRSSKATLRKICESDLVLTLDSRAKKDLFEERWIGDMALKSTELLASQDCHPRTRCITKLVNKLKNRLDVDDWQDWPKNQKESFRNLTPVTALIDNISTWKKSDKNKLVSLMRSKGSKRELQYVEKLRKHDRLMKSLVNVCNTDHKI